MVSQNGTNDLHGSFVFKRNTPGLNAYQKWGGPHGEAPQRANQLQSQTAGSLGGPLLRDKLFFFFSYEGQRQDKNSLTTAWVETPELVAAINAQRAGSLATQFLNYPGMTPPRVATVLETRDLGSLTGALGQPVTEAAGGGLDGIPDVQRAQLEGFSKTTAQQFNTRVDYSVTQNDRLAFSMFYVPVNTRSNDAGANSARPMGDFLSERRNMAGTLLWTRTLSPTMINEARFNVMRWYFDEIASNPDTPWGLPRLQVNQPAGENLLLTYGPGVGPGVFYQTSYNFRDTLTKVLNSHALKFGVDIVAEQNNDKAPWAGRPTYSFDNLWSFANDAPSSEGTTFFDPDSGAFTDLTAYARSSKYALFVQDDWKLTPTLTVNAGLRWDYFAPLRSKNDQISNLMLGPNEGLIGASLKLGGDLYEQDRNNFGPQAGFAWTPGRFNQKLVLRGGFGIGYNRLPGSRLLESRFNPPYFAGFLLKGAGHPLCTGGNRHRLRLPTQPGCDADVRSSDQPSGDRSARQRERDAAGPAQSVHAAVLGGLANTTSAVAGSPAWVTRAAAVEGCRAWCRTSCSSSRTRALGTVNMLLPDAYSHYNALLTRISRRFASGYLLNAEYRFGRSMDTCSNDQNCQQTYPFDQSTEWGPSDYDVTHSFKLYGTWDLPIFRDRRDALGFIAGGWQLSGILTASSGFPWTPVYGGGLCQVAVAGGSVCPQRPASVLGRCARERERRGTDAAVRAVHGRTVQLLHAAARGCFRRAAAARPGPQQFPWPRLFHDRHERGQAVRVPVGSGPRQQHRPGVSRERVQPVQYAQPEAVCVQQREHRHLER